MGGGVLCKLDVLGGPSPGPGPLVGATSDNNEVAATLLRVEPDGDRVARGGGVRTGGDPRRRRNLQETGAPPPRLLRPPPATTAAPASYRVSGASEDRTAEIRPLFRPGTAAHRSGRAADNSPRCPGRRKWGPQSPGRGLPGSAQSQNQLAGKTGAGAGSAARGCPLVDVGRHGTAAATQPPAGAGGEGTGKPPAPGAQPSAVFFQVRAGPGEPCVFVSGNGLLEN